MQVDLHMIKAIEYLKKNAICYSSLLSEFIFLSRDEGIYSKKTCQDSSHSSSVISDWETKSLSSLSPQIKEKQNSNYKTMV